MTAHPESTTAPTRTRTSTPRDGIVLVGGGLASQRCAETLRRSGYDGPLRIVCAEPEPPYDRPPLSKELLRGECTSRSLRLRSEAWYEAHDIDLLIGVRAEGLDLAANRVHLSNRTSLHFGRLLIATGGEPLTLPNLADHTAVSSLRTLADARRLRDLLARGSHLAIVGAGFIGQEVAATARSMGAEVTLIEAAPTPLGAMLGDELGEWFAALHRDEGVRVLTGCTVGEARFRPGECRLALSNGNLVVADHVLVGVGIAPAVRWLRGSGLRIEGGVAVDLAGRTSHPAVFAAGDAAARLDPLTGRYVAGSHWEAAARQGAATARAMLGLAPTGDPLGSFWSDQYGIRIQYLGEARAADKVELDGAASSRSFIAKYSKDGAAVAALLVNRPRELPAMRRLIEKGTAA
jgi:3-phenylpropionate/trans-cinnamate dioxygenase ferredoxin reductase subunit